WPDDAARHPHHSALGDGRAHRGPEPPRPPRPGDDDAGDRVLLESPTHADRCGDLLHLGLERRLALLGRRCRSGPCVRPPPRPRRWRPRALVSRPSGVSPACAASSASAPAPASVVCSASATVSGWAMSSRVACSALIPSTSLATPPSAITAAPTRNATATRSSSLEPISWPNSSGPAIPPAAVPIA